MNDVARRLPFGRLVDALSHAISCLDGQDDVGEKVSRAAALALMDELARRFADFRHAVQNGGHTVEVLLILEGVLDRGPDDSAAGRAARDAAEVQGVDPRFER